MTTRLFYDPMLVKIGGGSGYAGRWKGVQTDDGRTAIISCPKCGKLASLSTFVISNEGEVSPSFACPSKVPKPCDFNDALILEDWGSKKRRR